MKDREKIEKKRERSTFQEAEKKETNKQISDLKNEIDDLKDRNQELNLKQKEYETNLQRNQISMDNAKKLIADILKDNEWINEEKEFFGV